MQPPVAEPTPDPAAYPVLGPIPAPIPAPRAPKAPGRWRAVLVLYFLAALIPESIATANNPPLHFVQAPVLLPFLVAFYGGAAIAIRELRVRRGLRWSGLLLLGAAYGFLNEGVVAGTWYTVTYTGYTYLHGVDLAWAAFLTIFHAVFSVAIPILLVEIMFPAIADQRWVGRLGLVVSAALPLLICLLFIVDDDQLYRPQRAVVLLAALVLCVIGALLRRRHPVIPAAGALPSPGRIRWGGIGATLLWYVAGFLLPGIASSRAPSALDSLQFVYIGAMLVIFVVVALIAREWTRRPGWGPRQTLAGITGLLLPSIIVTNIQPVGIVGGGFLFSVPFVVLLIVLARRLRRRENSSIREVEVA